MTMPQAAGKIGGAPLCDLRCQDRDIETSVDTSSSLLRQGGKQRPSSPEDVGVRNRPGQIFWQTTLTGQMCVEVLQNKNPHIITPFPHCCLLSVHRTCKNKKLH